jgi:hypothetical protein
MHRVDSVEPRGAVAGRPLRQPPRGPAGRLLPVWVRARGALGPGGRGRNDPQAARHAGRRFVTAGTRGTNYRRFPDARQRDLCGHARSPGRRPKLGPSHARHGRSRASRQSWFLSPVRLSRTVHPGAREQFQVVAVVGIGAVEAPAAVRVVQSPFLLVSGSAYLVTACILDARARIVSSSSSLTWKA